MRQLLSPPTSIHTRSSRPRVAQAGRRASRRAKARACAAPLVSAGIGTSPPELREAEHKTGQGGARKGFAAAPAQEADALQRDEVQEDVVGVLQPYHTAAAGDVTEM